jgi:hypothetical protein
MTLYMVPVLVSVGGDNRLQQRGGLTAERVYVASERGAPFAIMVPVGVVLLLQVAKG